MIKNLISGDNQNKGTEEPAKAQPVEQKTEVQQQEAPAASENVQNKQVSKEAPEASTTSSTSGSYRRFMTPQLSADLSQFSGLSLRLEDNKKAHASNFPLKQGRPFVIGVCGGNCAGKMELVNYLVKHWGEKRCTTLKQENFYYTPPHGEALEDYNYDDPDATDWQYMEDALDALLYHKKAFHTPIYNFKLNKRDLRTEEIWPNPIIIVEGLLIFHIDGIRDRLDLKIFLDTDDDIRLSRRIMKGYMKLGRNVDSIVERYKKFVKPCHETYVLPSRKFADIIIPNFGSTVCEEIEAFNQTKDKKDTKDKEQSHPKINLALELMVEQVKSHLEELNQIRTFQHQQKI